MKFIWSIDIVVKPTDRLFYLNCEDCDYYDKKNDLCMHDDCPIMKNKGVK